MVFFLKVLACFLENTNIWLKSWDFWFALIFLKIYKIYRLKWIFHWIFGCFVGIYFINVSLWFVQIFTLLNVAVFMNPPSTKRSNWFAEKLQIKKNIFIEKIGLECSFFSVFTNILNFNPQLKNCCVWASSAEGKQQTELFKSLGRQLPFVTAHSKWIMYRYNYFLKIVNNTPKQLREMVSKRKIC
jgi:hypothetical protein